MIARAVTDSRPRTRYTIGKGMGVFTRMADILPDRVLASSLRPHYPKD